MIHWTVPKKFNFISENDSKMAAAPNDWQLNCTKMKQRGAFLLQSGQWSDCTFLVGSEPNQVSVSGHKLILAMASPVFEAMFFGGMPERDDAIPILDVQPDAFKALLEYIYTDEININSFDKACELCYGAKKYMLPHLVKECTKYLWSDLYPKNACRAYEFAKLFEENVLIEKCLQIISTNTMDVLHDNSFEDVEINTVVTVFSMDHLNIESELDLFEAATRYSKAQEKRLQERSASPPPLADQRKSPEPSTSKEKVVNVDSSGENSPEAAPSTSDTAESRAVTTVTGHTDDKPDEMKRQENKDKPTIRSAIEKIRFLTLTPQQFAGGPARSPLLTETESFAVLMNIISCNSDVAMPAGFSTCREPRKQLIQNNMPTFTVDTPSPVMVDQVFGSVDARPSNPVASGSNHGGWPVYPRSRHEMMPSLLHHIPDHPERHHAELNKMYCQRPIIQHTDCLNTSVLDSSVTFMVDKNICLLGVQVPTQAPSEELGASGPAGAAAVNPAGGYSELLYAHLLDADGARLTYTHYTNRVPYRHLLDICFNRPVYIQRNKVYKVGIVFNKVGWYPMGTCAHQVSADSVYFTFGIGQSIDSVRDGLIRSIIFTY